MRGYFYSFGTSIPGVKVVIQKQFYLKTVTKYCTKKNPEQINHRSDQGSQAETCLLEIKYHHYPDLSIHEQISYQEGWCDNEFLPAG